MKARCFQSLLAALLTTACGTSASQNPVVSTPHEDRCDDGTVPNENCGQADSACPPGQILAIRGSCYQCVWSDTCALPEVSPTNTLAVGGFHVCAVRVDGRLFCWGLNDLGQLGFPTGSSVGFFEPEDKILAPHSVDSVSDWRSISAGYTHTCGLRTNGALWCWGDNAQGRIIDPDSAVGAVESCLPPQPISTDRDWNMVSTGHKHNCAIKNDGSLWCWGDNSVGQVGDGTTIYRGHPTEPSPRTKWQTVAAGLDHSCGVQTNDTLWCWGLNNHGQLGQGHEEPVDEMVQVGADNSWQGVTGNGSHSCAIDIAARMWCWGENSSGKLGDGTQETRSSPQLVHGTLTWSTSAATMANTYGLSGSHDLWSWGNNFRGQLGDGHTTGPSGDWDQHEPALISATGDWQIVRGSTGGIGILEPSACALRTNGALFCWGSNSYGQVGVGEPSASFNLPREVVMGD